MFYTIIGAIVGGFIFYIVANAMSMSFDKGYAPSTGQLTVMAGVLIGGGAGFGYGTLSLIQGNHIIVKATKMYI